MSRKSVAAVLLAAALTSCAASEIASSSTPRATASETTSSAAPTQSPTAEPSASPTAEAVGVSLEEIAEAFRNSGVEIGEVREMTVADYGPAPKADEGLRFLIPSLGEDAGGRIMRYDKAEVADRAQAYYEELGEQSALLFSHVFRRGNLVVQINGTLPQDQADLLEAVLDTVLPEDGS